MNKYVTYVEKQIEDAKAELEKDGVSNWQKNVYKTQIKALGEALETYKAYKVDEPTPGEKKKESGILKGH